MSRVPILITPNGNKIFLVKEKDDQTPSPKPGNYPVWKLVTRDSILIEKCKGYNTSYSSLEKMNIVDKNTEHYSSDGNTFNFSENGRTFSITIDSEKEFSRILDCIQSAKEIEICECCSKEIVSKSLETSHRPLCNDCAYLNNNTYIAAFYIRPC